MRSFLFVLFLFPIVLFAQEGKVIVNEKLAVRGMLDHRKALNFQSNRVFTAWSVQLLITRDKYKVKTTELDIKRQLSGKELSIDWFYEEPYYRIYVGCFYTKIEAAALLNELLPLFPKAYLFKNNEAKPSNM